MKRIILLLLLACTLAMPAQQNKLTIGINGGPSLNSIFGYKPLIPTTKRNMVGVSTGIYVQYNLPKLLSFVGEISYASKGEVVQTVVTDAITQATGTFKARRTLNYATLPLMLRIGAGKKLRWFVEAGAFASYLIKAQSEVISTPVPVNDKKSDLGYEFKKYDFGAIAGIGGSLQLNKSFLVSLEIRECRGLYNTSAFPFIDKNSSLKTNSVNVLLGIAYTLKPRA